MRKLIKLAIDSDQETFNTLLLDLVDAVNENMKSAQENFEGPKSSIKKTFDEAVGMDGIEEAVEGLMEGLTGQGICFYKREIKTDRPIPADVDIRRKLRTTFQSQQDHILKVASDYMNEVDYQNFIKDLGV